MALFKENMLVSVLSHFRGNNYLGARAVCMNSVGFFLKGSYESRWLKPVVTLAVLAATALCQQFCKVTGAPNLK